MKIIQFKTPGGPSVLDYVEVPTPEPKEGEVLVRAHAIGVGMPNIMIRRGTYNWMPPLPGTPGTEMSGVVEKIGLGVKTLRPGQRVVVSARDRPHRGGCYAEYNATPESSAYALPDGADMVSLVIGDREVDVMAAKGAGGPATRRQGAKAIVTSYHARYSGWSVAAAGPGAIIQSLNS